MYIYIYPSIQGSSPDSAWLLWSRFFQLNKEFKDAQEE